MSHIINISLGELFLRTYGRPSEAVQVNDVAGEKEFGRKEQGKYGSPFYAKDALGREYYMPIEVNVGNEVIPGTNTTYAEKLGVRNSQGAYDGRWMLPHPVISAELMVNVVETALTERKGMVSELINMNAYRMRVRGFIINPIGNEFPEDEVDTLDRLVKLGIPVRISCPLTDILLSDLGEERYVTFRRLTWPELPGVKHVKPYELEMQSEIPFNLEEI